MEKREGERNRRRRIGREKVLESVLLNLFRREEEKRESQMEKRGKDVR